MHTIPGIVTTSSGGATQDGDPAHSVVQRMQHLATYALQALGTVLTYPTMVAVPDAFTKLRSSQSSPVPCGSCRPCAPLATLARPTCCTPGCVVCDPVVPRGAPPWVDICVHAFRLGPKPLDAAGSCMCMLKGPEGFPTEAPKGHPSCLCSAAHAIARPSLPFFPIHVPPREEDVVLVIRVQPRLVDRECLGGRRGEVGVREGPTQVSRRHNSPMPAPSIPSPCRTQSHFVTGPQPTQAPRPRLNTL